MSFGKPAYNAANKASIGAPLVDKQKELINFVHTLAPQIRMALPKHITADRMLSVFFTEIRKNPKLVECTKASFLGSIIQCAQLGLEPGSGLGHAYLIPYGKECQFLIGYQGMTELAHRNGITIGAHSVYENDVFDFEYGSKPFLRHKPMFGLSSTPGQFMGTYAVATFKDGRVLFHVSNLAEIEAARARSKSSSGPWRTDFEAMARKTPIRRLFKDLPKTAEMGRAQELEDVLDIGERQGMSEVFERFKEEHKIPSQITDEVESETEAANNENPASENPLA